MARTVSGRKSAAKKGTAKTAAPVEQAAPKKAAPKKAGVKKAGVKQAGVKQAGVAEAGIKKVGVRGVAAAKKTAAPKKAAGAKKTAARVAATRRAPARRVRPAPPSQAKSGNARSGRAKAAAPKTQAAKAKPAAPQSFTVSHLNESDFKADGLRSYALYRDLGIATATGGLCQAHVLRLLSPCTDEVRQRHLHEVDLQLIYVLKGWIKNEFEGHGVQMMSAGSCWLQPPGVEHTVLDYSADVELLEIVVPADFKTVDLT